MRLADVEPGQHPLELARRDLAGTAATGGVLREPDGVRGGRHAVTRATRSLRSPLSCAPLRHDDVLRVARRGEPGLEDAEPGEHRAGDVARRPRQRDSRRDRRPSTVSAAARRRVMRDARPHQRARAALLVGLGEHAQPRASGARPRRSRRPRRRSPSAEPGRLCATGVQHHRDPAGRRGAASRRTGTAARGAPRATPGRRCSRSARRCTSPAADRSTAAPTPASRPRRGSRPVTCDAAAAPDRRAERREDRTSRPRAARSA